MVVMSTGWYLVLFGAAVAIVALLFEEPPKPDDWEDWDD